MSNKENKLFRRLVKDKKLQRLGNSFVLIVPKTWIKALNWSQETQLTMALHPEDRKVIISEKKEDKNKISEEVNDADLAQVIGVTEEMEVTDEETCKHIQV
jgi:antitoxin component of MazEF toxin-antitoxin module